MNNARASYNIFTFTQEVKLFCIPTYQRLNDFINGWTDSFREGHDLQNLMAHDQTLQQCFRIILQVGQGKEKNIINANSGYNKKNGGINHNLSLPKFLVHYTFVVQVYKLWSK